MIAAITCRSSSARILNVVHAARELINSALRPCFARVLLNAGSGKHWLTPVPIISTSLSTRHSCSSRAGDNAENSRTSHSAGASSGAIRKLVVKVFSPTTTPPEPHEVMSVLLCEISASSSMVSGGFRCRLQTISWRQKTLPMALLR